MTLVNGVFVRTQEDLDRAKAFDDKYARPRCRDYTVAVEQLINQVKQARYEKREFHKV
jgi:hypothetical protein